MKDRQVQAFSPEDMKRRRSRSVALAVVLLALLVIVFITTIYKIKQGMH
jgi:hypothetical protein